MQHLIFDNNSGKSITLTCEETTLITETNTAGKVKTASKSFADHKEAVTQFLKKEWELLKKGAVMKAPTAALGHPLLHIYLGKGYTGCLSFAATPHGVYVYRPGDEQRDELVRITADGNIAEVLILPGLLAWEICYDAQRNMMLLDLDHYIYQYDFSAFTQLTHGLDKPASFASIGGDTWAYATHPAYYINSKKFPLDVEFVNGSIPFCAKLSPDGKLLALHHKVGEIQVISTEDDSVVNTLRGDFKIAEQLLWTRDSSQIIVHELYGGIRFFEMVTGDEVSEEGLMIPEAYSKDVGDCCLNEENSLLVCVQRTRGYVFDFVKKEFLYEFPLQHCVKRAQVRFMDDKTVGVRTDYGCFSIYRVK
ncbi:hypothetical protein [Chitinophaga sancti]|uniref:WD40 repeat n=1 Tax=Chitinophaga sancti TaxID=1004 RepID=A0A1K1SI00_9BACT|nr:hypothetical protein [Chitinophaga sancti]WQD61781.1 hypothetical protein U0033_28265 [Chitinophaga sancti]WQG92650.1 hypothetical protein SR876_14120 [Chitinophaga sancti]SFW84024.1 hypothetical protein SAMN05661012_05497 [Chitinophaga sancti]